MTGDEVFKGLWPEVISRFPSVADYYRQPDRLPNFRKTLDFWAYKLRNVPLMQAVAALDALHDDPARSPMPADFFPAFLRRATGLLPRGASSGLEFRDGVQVNRCKNWCSEGMLEIVGNGSPAVNKAWALYVVPLLRCKPGDDRRPIDNRPIHNNGPLSLTGELIDELCCVGHDGFPRLTRALAFEVGVHFPIGVRCDCMPPREGMASFNPAWMVSLREEVNRRFRGEGSSGGMVDVPGVFEDARSVQKDGFAF